MAVDMSGFTTILFQWVVNPLIWLIIIVVLLGVTAGFLSIRKKRKLKFEAIEIVAIGNRKPALNTFKVGWFGKKTFLFGLWDYGDEVLKNKWGEIILDFSTEDYVEINGHRGVLCFRHPTNQKMLLPISKVIPVTDENGKRKDAYQLLAEIPNSDFTQAAVDIINDATKETKDWKEQMIQWLIFGGIIIFALVSIIVISQMVKNGQTEAAKLITSAGETCMTNAKQVCSEIVTAAANKGAP